MIVKKVLTTLALSFTVSAATIWVYDRHFAQKIVTFDMNSYLADQKNLYVNGKLDDKELEAELKAVADIINSLPGNHVVLVSDVVLKGAEVVRP